MLKNSRRTRPIAEINVVPYIDVMLVLLVIFMITAPMLTQGVTVDLPKAPSDKIKSGEREPVIVSVDKEGRYYLNVSSTPDQPVMPKTLMIRVAAELELARQSQQPLNVLVKGDQGVSYGAVIQAMSLLKQAGAQKVGLITDSAETAQENQA